MDAWLANEVTADAAEDSARWRELRTMEHFQLVALARDGWDDAKAALGWVDEDAAASAPPAEHLRLSVAEMDRISVPQTDQPRTRPGSVAQDLHPDVLAGMAGDAGLAAVLEGVDPESLGTFEAVEVVAAFKRVEAWAAGQAALAAAALSRMPRMSAPMPGGSPWDPLVNGTAEELAMRLATTRAEAARLVKVGQGLRTTFTDTAAALSAGVIDWRKACTIVSTLWDSPSPVAWTVEQEVLEGAAHRTPTQLSRDVAKALVAVDPEEAEARHRRARRKQHVTHPRPLPDGMASMYILAGAEDAVPFDLLLTAAAAAAQADGDSRSTDELRAEALFAMAAGAMHSGVVGVPDGHCTCPSHPAPADAPMGEVSAGAGSHAGTEAGAPAACVLDPGSDAGTDVACGSGAGPETDADATSGPGLRPETSSGAMGGVDRGTAGTAATGSKPPGTAGTGSKPPGTAGTGGSNPPGASNSDELRTDTDSAGTTPLNGPPRRPGSWAVPGAHEPGSTATSSVAGHPVAPDAPDGRDAPAAPDAHQAREVAGTPPPAGEPGLPALHLLLRQRRGMRLGPPGSYRTEVRVTVPLNLLLPPAQDPSAPGGAGTDPGTTKQVDEDLPFDREPLDAVPELAGYGPIAPDLARALAAGGTWRRLVTDPVSGSLVDIGRSRYRPPRELARWVRERDRTCVSPGCTVPAAQCQIDHTVAWSQGGVTAHHNTGLQCGRDHTLKTAGLFKVTQPTPGVFEWLTPSGHAYRREVDGSVTPLHVSPFATPQY